MTTGFGRELFLWFNVCAFRECLSICEYASSLFDFEGGMWDLMVLVPEHCLSILFLKQCSRITIGSD